MPLTTAQVAERLGLSERTIRDALASGSMAGTKAGPRTWLVDELEADRYGRENRGKPGRKPAMRTGTT